MAVSMVIVRMPWQLSHEQIEEWKRYFTSIGLDYKGYYPYAEYTDLVLTANALSSDIIKVLDSIEGVTYHIVPVDDTYIENDSEDNEFQEVRDTQKQYDTHMQNTKYNPKPPPIPKPKESKAKTKDIAEYSHNMSVENIREQISEMEEYLSFVKRKARAIEKQIKRLKSSLKEVEDIEDEEVE